MLTMLPFQSLSLLLSFHLMDLDRHPSKFPTNLNSRLEQILISGNSKPWKSGKPVGGRRLSLHNGSITRLAALFATGYSCICPGQEMHDPGVAKHLSNWDSFRFFGKRDVTPTT